MAIRVFHRDTPDRLLPMISRDARLIVWPGVGAMTANMNYVRLEPGEANIPHIHAGQAIHVPIGVKHAVAAGQGVGVVSTGGPCPADFRMLKAVGAWPAE